MRECRKCQQKLRLVNISVTIRAAPGRWVSTDYSRTRTQKRSSTNLFLLEFNVTPICVHAGAFDVLFVGGRAKTFDVFVATFS